MIVVFLIIFIISFILALYSMKDLSVPKELRRLISRKQIRGTILFFKNKTLHYKAKK